MLKFNALQSAKVSESIATKNQNVTKNVTKETEILALLREDASMTTTEIICEQKNSTKRTREIKKEKLH